MVPEGHRIPLHPELPVKKATLTCFFASQDIKAEAFLHAKCFCLPNENVKTNFIGNYPKELACKQTKTPDIRVAKKEEGGSLILAEAVAFVIFDPSKF